MYGLLDSCGAAGPVLAAIALARPAEAGCEPKCRRAAGEFSQQVHVADALRAKAIPATRHGIFKNALTTPHGSPGRTCNNHTYQVASPCGQGKLK
jgi:hypothetical protein